MSPAVLRGENSGNALEASNALNYRVWGVHAVLSRGIPGKAPRAFPGSFRDFFWKVPAVLGHGPQKFPNAVVLNAVERRNTQRREQNKRTSTQKSPKGHKIATLGKRVKKRLLVKG